MTWIIRPLLIPFLVIALQLGARGEVRVWPADRQTCSASGDFVLCELTVKIIGQIDDYTFNEFKRLVDQVRQEAKSKKGYFAPPTLYLIVPAVASLQRWP
jgi:hypothetical protein